MPSTSTDMLIYLVLVSIGIFAVLYAINLPADPKKKIPNLVLSLLIVAIPVTVGTVKLLSGIKFPAAAPRQTQDPKFDAEKTALLSDMGVLGPILTLMAATGENRYNDIASDGDLYESFQRRSLTQLAAVNDMVKKYETTAFESGLKDRVSDLTNLLKNAQTAARNFKGVFADENGADFSTYQGPAGRALGFLTAVTNGL